MLDKIGVSLEEIKRRLEAKEPMVLVDVREKDEVRAGFIPGCVAPSSSWTADRKSVV